MEHLQNIYDDLGWEEAKGYPTGTKIKVLRDDNNAKTVVLKLPKGFYMEAHTHVYNEQHVVLEGEYEIEDKKYISGTYSFIPAHQDHGPFLSNSGALLLIIWDYIH